MTDKKKLRPVEILLVEDNPDDVELTKEMMERSKIRINMKVVSDGVEAMQYLHKEDKYAKAIRPDLILLDLNMPRKDGRETLQEIKRDEKLKMIPVVILTSSDEDTDIVKTYTNGASCYITKPVGLEQFSKLVKSIENFWLTVVIYPPRE